MTSDGGTGRATPANRLGLDYRREAERFPAVHGRIIDVHTHVNGRRAAGIYKKVAELYGVRLTYSQTQFAQAGDVRDVLGGMVRFIAIPEYMAEDRQRAFTTGFLEQIRAFHDEFGARMVKLWSAPRLVDLMEEAGIEGATSLESPWRIRAAETAAELGMMLMTHVSDPDTWFRARYTDPKRYGTKLDQYKPLERMLERFPVPWMAAHMAGWPEDLVFLDGLLERHDNLYLDTSATKWMVRELSKHPRDELIGFLARWKGRVMFGSDIVTSDDHLETSDPGNDRFGSQLASDEREAFDLYASRYWALRTMFETGYDGESNIADPDLAMVEPEAFDAMSAPRLRGFGLSEDVLESLYFKTAESLFSRFDGFA